MKTLNSLTLALLTAAVALAADDYGLQKDKQGRWAYPECNFTAKKGDWFQARNWLDGRAPSAPMTRVNLVTGCTLTLSKPVKEPVSLLFLGFGQEGGHCQMYIEPGAKLNTGGLWLPNGSVNDSTAALYMKGGELTVGGVKEHTHFMDVGFGSTTSGAGTFVLSGGTLTVNVQLRVGSPAPKTNTGRFVVQGSKPVFTQGPLADRGIRVYPSGTLEFVLDEKGVAPMVSTKGRLILMAGATVRVDGKAYTGGSKTFTLVQAVSVFKEGGEPTFEVTGFARPYQGQLSVDKDKLLLRVSKGG